MRLVCAWACLALLAPALAACSERSGDVTNPTPTPFPPGVITRPDRRPSNCPTAVGMKLDSPLKGMLSMDLGPVSLSFAADGVDADSRVLPYGRNAQGLILKLPMNIRGAVGMAITLRGSKAGTGAPVKYEGPGTDGEYVENASFELTFAPPPPSTVFFLPGAMLFPGPGCYQVFVGVDGVEYGPFGFELAPPPS